MEPRQQGKAAVGGGITLAYEDFGPEDAPAIVLIMGLGAQLVFWPDGLVEGLVARGYRVVRFDNRDIGLSTKLEGVKPPRLGPLVLSALVGLPMRVPYRLDDMARDTVGLLDALGIARAHIVGASMGGMIAQLVAADHPARTLSLTSIMSTSGARRVSRPDPAMLRILTRQRPVGGTRDELIAEGVLVLKAIGTPDGGRSDDDRRELVARAVDRSVYREGPARQLAAIVGSGSRLKRLRGIAVPTLVIHGTADRLVPPAGGLDTAKRVPGARAVLLDGMAHDLPPDYVPRIATLIADHAAGAR